MLKEINGIDIKHLAETYGTPLYVYDQSKIIDNYNKLKTAFDKHYKNTKIHFSVKANSNIHILKIFKELGAGVDCSSPIEYHLSKRAGFDGENILYTGNYESPEDFNTIKGENLRLNLDDITSLKRVLKVWMPEQISFRINPGIGRGGYEGITTAGTDAKFGIPYEKAYEAYKLAKDAGIKRFGIHMMTGSNNLEPYFFAEIVEKLMLIASDIFDKLDIQPEYVDIGGGLGVPYKDIEEELNVDLMAQLVSDLFREKCEKYGFGTPDLILEPGRYLVANSGYLITKVTGIKHSYKTFIGLDAGMNTLLRPALYGAEHRISVYNKNGGDNISSLCGQICENSDIFLRNVPLPEIEEDDIVVFHDTGAYGYVMSSIYNNRTRPAELLIHDSKEKLIRRRENLEDILNLYPEL